MTANLSPNAMGLQSIASTPIAVVDVETTGLMPGADHVVEVAVARVDPGSSVPQLVFESLVNPLRSMAATEIHGITEEAVAEAPKFSDIAGDLVDALSGCCVAGYNANFDIGMLRREFQQCGVRSFSPPYICLKNIRARLGLGYGTLEDACKDHNVGFYAGHFAAYDALSEAELLIELLPIFLERKIEKFGHFVSGRPVAAEPTSTSSRRLRYRNRVPVPGQNPRKRRCARNAPGLGPLPRCIGGSGRRWRGD